VTLTVTLEHMAYRRVAFREYIGGVDAAYIFSDSSTYTCKSNFVEIGKNSERKLCRYRRLLIRYDTIAMEEFNVD